MNESINPGRLALLVGGGPAPGINGVISSATIAAISQGMEVIGLQDGYKWIAQGDLGHCRPLNIEDVKGIYLRGGSILGTSRFNPAKSQEHMNKVLNGFRQLGVSCLVSIGGDDTAFSASQVYKQAQGAVRVAHVPKTIDNDLPLPGSTPTFGFETARHVGVSILHNLAEDARTTSRWYLIVSMGRAAGHLALGIGKAAAATLTIIPEEFRGKHVKPDHLCDLILGSIIKRRSHKNHFGVAILAEGLLEAIGEKDLLTWMNVGAQGRYGILKRDDHGHLRLGEIEFGRMVKDRLAERINDLEKTSKVKLDVNLVDKDLGYELRCADPIPFDGEYTRDLGYAAVKFLCSAESAAFGAVINFVGGRMDPLPFDTLINPDTGRMKPRKLNIDSESYECARRYMIRLERSDFEEARKLEEIAATAGMTADQFRKRFGYVVGLEPPPEGVN